MRVNPLTVKEQEIVYACFAEMTIELKKYIAAGGVLKDFLNKRFPRFAFVEVDFADNLRKDKRILMNENGKPAGCVAHLDSQTLKIDPWISAFKQFPYNFDIILDPTPIIE